MSRKLRKTQKPFLIRKWRWGLASLTLGAILTLGLTGTLTQWKNSVANHLTEYSTNAGLKVNEIYVQGRLYTDPEQLRQLIGIERGDPIIGFKPKETQTRLKTLPWIREARVERRMPDSIYIDLVEKQPIGLWQKNKELILIDDQGDIIDTPNLEGFGNLPILIGDDAPLYARELLGMIYAEEKLGEQVYSATRIGGRRWDLETTTNIKIKLPEHKMEMAIARLGSDELQDKLQQKNISVIDLRYPEKVIFKLKHEKKDNS